MGEGSYTWYHREGRLTVQGEDHSATPPAETPAQVCPGPGGMGKGNGSTHSSHGVRLPDRQDRLASRN